MKQLYTNRFLALFLGAALLFFSCEEENTGPSGQPSGEFSFAVDEENPMAVNFNSTIENAFAYIWDFGDGSKVVADNPTHVYSDPGTFSVTLTVYGGEGTEPAVVTKDVTVEEAVFDGGMLSQEGWTVTHGVGGNTVNVDDKNGFEVLGSGITGETPEADWQNVMVWQAVDVEAGKIYQFDAYITANGSESTWAQVYFGGTEPVDGGDYSDNKVYGVSSWGTDGSCIGDAIVFTSVLNARCEGLSGSDDGTFTFETSQTLYIIFKTGSQTGSHDIKWGNILFREAP